VSWQENAVIEGCAEFCAAPVHILHPLAPTSQLPAAPAKPGQESRRLFSSTHRPLPFTHNLNLTTAHSP
jgi:hypothetical protein